MSDFAANPLRKVSVLEVGRDRRPVICIDEFLSKPEQMVELASRADFIGAGPVYPGVRAPAPLDYVRSLLDAASEPIAQAFGAPPSAELELCAFSLVSTPPADLRPIQRIPHFDGPESHRIAFVHFLCAGWQGGTSFYRHRASGLEAVNEESLDRYRRLVAQELGPRAVPAEYAGAATGGFEKLISVEAAFNRLIIYKGNALHSGDIGEHTVLSEDPRRGRLTINGFGHLST